MKDLLRSICYDGLLYIANRIVSRVPSHSVRLFFYRRIMKFSIGLSSFIFMDAWFDTKGKGSFIMGHNSVINQKCRLDNRGSIIIGDNVSISAEVCILTADHDLQSSTFQGRTRRVSIGDFTFIGTRAMLLPGSHCGEGRCSCSGRGCNKGCTGVGDCSGMPGDANWNAKPILRIHYDYNRRFC